MILITGHKGFIGYNLSKHFNPADTILLDFNNCNNIFDMDWTKIEKIYHIGAISSTTEKNIDLLHNYNVQYSIMLFNIAIEYQIPIVHLSSASVFGNSLIYSYNPLNYYSLSKTTVDLYIEDNLDKFSNMVVIRPFNVYGKHENHKGNQASPITQFTDQALNNKVVRVFENSDNYIRDFIWVEDLIKCIQTDMPSGFYDGGTSSPISFQKVAELISEKYNVPIEIIPFPEHLKNKYQYYTCARKHFDINFTSVENYLNDRTI
jgi:ADP-L-glycero-D-manno-heptose 6-epimerase